MPTMQAREYHWGSAEHSGSHSYLLPPLHRIMASWRGERRCFDLGCGNGSIAAAVASRGWDVTAVDPSRDGVGHARSAYPDLNVHEAEAGPELVERFGRFPVVYSLEVVEHVYAPRVFAKAVHDLTTPGGMAVISTPYHGYLKNLALALTGKMDAHFTALWDHGHIKFWSQDTLGKLLREAGFKTVRFHRVGRVPPLAKSMIAVARR